MKADRSWRYLVAGSLAVTAMFGVSVPGEVGRLSAKQMVEAMIGREQQASHDSVHYTYLSNERSERTKGHLWTERMIETDWGTIRFLLAVDGERISADQISLERTRLAAETADPDVYKRRELKQDNGEHSRQMLAAMPRAFLFGLLGEDPQEIRIGYRPAPAYVPQTMEERAMHGMVGTVVLDAKTLRLRRLEGRAPSDVSLGFGPFATLRAGSAFSTSREQLQDAVWRTYRVETTIEGKALLLKSIARQQTYVHSEFKRIPAGLNLKGAVAIAEQ